MFMSVKTLINIVRRDKSMEIEENNPDSDENDFI